VSEHGIGTLRARPISTGSLASSSRNDFVAFRKSSPTGRNLDPSGAHDPAPLPVAVASLALGIGPALTARWLTLEHLRPPLVSRLAPHGDRALAESEPPVALPPSCADGGDGLGPTGAAGGAIIDKNDHITPLEK
jgi:hypothetical protein